MKEGEIKKLIHELGAKSFDPMPPDQHQWQMGKDHPPLIRIWSWLCGHTIHWNGQERSTFAIDKEGHELRLERIADDLKIDEGNVRQYWAQGVQLGLWRNGTKKEGSRRLYLCGEVKPIQEAPVVDVNGKPKVEDAVRTYRSKRMRPYLLAQIDALPQEAQDSYWAEWTPRHLAVDQSFAELVACHRQVADEDDDNQFARYSVKKIRETHNPKGSEEQLEALRKEAEARRKRMEAIRPEVERYIRTVEKLVQEEKKSTYEPTVQSKNADATLLSSDLQRGTEGGRESHLYGPPSNSETPPVDKKSPPKLVPVPEELVSQPAKLTEQEQAFFGEMGRWRKDTRHFDFDEAISPQNKGQLATVRKILAVVKGDEAFFRRPDPKTLSYVEQRAYKPALGKRATLAFISTWADDYAALAPQREEAKAAAARAEQNSAALNAELEAAHEADLAVADKAAEIWDGLTEDERNRRAAKHLQVAKREHPRMTPDQQHFVAENKARQDIREKEINQEAVKAAILTRRNPESDEAALKSANETLERLGIYVGVEKGKGSNA
jgi:hypothetical protein